jgi:hypothetical protein
LKYYKEKEKDKGAAINKDNRCEFAKKKKKKLKDDR